MKVATWNLWWRFGEWDKRLPAIRSVLDAASPDICGLQEVWLDGDHNLADELAGALGLHAVWVRSPRPERWHARLPGCRADVANTILFALADLRTYGTPPPIGSFRRCEPDGVALQRRLPERSNSTGHHPAHIGAVGLGNSLRPGTDPGRGSGGTHP